MEKETSESPNGRQKNKATIRILQVLSQFAYGHHSYGVTEIAETFGMTKNMAHRALNTLVDQGCLIKDGTKYELSYGVLGFLNHNFPEPDFRTISWPYIEELYELVNETILLSIRTGDKQVIIDGIQGKGATVARLQIGLSLPLHISGASRSILASLPDKKIEDYISRRKPLKKFTESTIVTPSSLWEEIHKIRENGYASGMGDFRLGSNSISFPIMAADNRPHGAITIGGPSDRFTKEVIKDLLPEIQAIINNLKRWAQLYPANIMEY